MAKDAWHQTAISSPNFSCSPSQQYGTWLLSIFCLTQRVPEVIMIMGIGQPYDILPLPTVTPFPVKSLH